MITYTHHGLKAGMQLDKKRRLLAQRQYTLLNHGALDIVVLYNHILFEYLNCIQLLAALALRQQHLHMHMPQKFHKFNFNSGQILSIYLAKGALAQHFNKIKVCGTYHVLFGL